MNCFQRLRSLAGQGIAVGALCIAMAGMSQAANIFVAIGLQPASVTPGTGGTAATDKILSGTLPVQFVNGGVNGQGATSVVGQTPWTISAHPGAVITMNIVELISNNSGNPSLSGAGGAFLSMDSLGSALGNYVLPTPSSAWNNATLGKPGLLTNADGDGDADVGGVHTVATAGTTVDSIGAWVPIPTVAPSPAFDFTGTAGNGFVKEILGTVTWTLAAGATTGQTTLLELFPTVIQSAKGFNWSADGTSPIGGTTGANNAANPTTPGNILWLNGGQVPTLANSVSPGMVATGAGVLVNVLGPIVPEPGTIVLMGIGMAGLVACARRRRA